MKSEKKIITFVNPYWIVRSSKPQLRWFKHKREFISPCSWSPEVEPTSKQLNLGFKEVIRYLFPCLHISGLLSFGLAPLSGTVSCGTKWQPRTLVSHAHILKINTVFTVTVAKGFDRPYVNIMAHSWSSYSDQSNRAHWLAWPVSLFPPLTLKDQD